MLELARDISSGPTPQSRLSVEIVRGADRAHIHCVHAGTGPSVLLAHGYLLEHAFFDLVFAELVRCGHRVIAFDQRGHGRSVGGSEGYEPAAAASDYAAILNHFDVRDGVLVAHSMGSFLGLAFCLQHAALARRRLRRLVLLGGTAGEVGKGSLHARADERQLLRSLERDPDRNAHSVRRPRPHLSPSHSRRLGAGLPDASSRWLPGIGHMLAYEVPDVVVEAVREA